MDKLELERYRSYLVLLARMEIGRQIQPKPDAAAFVQVLLERVNMQK